MRKRVLLFLFILLSISIINFSSASPAPWGIAINSETKECSGFWGGDEFRQYNLLEGWVAYYPNEESIIETPFGNCNFIRNIEEECCNEIKLDYINYKIADKKITMLGVEYFITTNAFERLLT